MTEFNPYTAADLVVQEGVNRDQNVMQILGCLEQVCRDHGEIKTALEIHKEMEKQQSGKEEPPGFFHNIKVTPLSTFGNAIRGLQLEMQLVSLAGEEIDRQELETAYNNAKITVLQKYAEKLGMAQDYETTGELYEAAKIYIELERYEVAADLLVKDATQHSMDKLKYLIASKVVPYAEYLPKLMDGRFNYRTAGLEDFEDFHRAFMDLFVLDDDVPPDFWLKEAERVTKLFHDFAIRQANRHLASFVDGDSESIKELQDRLSDVEHVMLHGCKWFGYRQIEENWHYLKQIFEKSDDSEVLQIGVDLSYKSTAYEKTRIWCQYRLGDLDMEDAIIELSKDKFNLDYILKILIREDEIERAKKLALDEKDASNAFLSGLIEILFRNKEYSTLAEFAKIENNICKYTWYRFIEAKNAETSAA